MLSALTISADSYTKQWMLLMKKEAALDSHASHEGRPSAMQNGTRIPCFMHQGGMCLFVLFSWVREYSQVSLTWMDVPDPLQLPGFVLENNITSDDASGNLLIRPVSRTFKKKERALRERLLDQSE